MVLVRTLFQDGFLCLLAHSSALTATWPRWRSSASPSRTAPQQRHAWDAYEHALPGQPRTGAPLEGARIGSESLFFWNDLTCRLRSWRSSARPVGTASFGSAAHASRRYALPGQPALAALLRALISTLSQNCLLCGSAPSAHQHALPGLPPPLCRSWRSPACSSFRTSHCSPNSYLSSACSSRTASRGGLAHGVHRHALPGQLSLAAPLMAHIGMLFQDDLTGLLRS